MTQDAVQEFKVFRNQFDAQYGAALNAVVNVVTKSGGNSPSGTGYYFGRDKALNARNAKAATVPPFKQARIGGTYGGPIVQNRTHMFARVRVPDHRQGGHRLAAGQQPVCGPAERQLPVQRHRAPGRRPGRPPVQRRPVDVRPLRLRQPVHAERRPDERRQLDRRQQQVAQHRRRAQLGAVAEHGQHAARPLPRPQPVHRADQLRPADLPAVVYVRTERRGAAVLPAQDRQLLRDLLHQHAEARHQDRRRVHARLEQLRGALHRARRVHLPDRHAVQRRRFPQPGRSPSSSRRPGSTTTRRIRLPRSSRTTGASPTACASTWACATTSTRACGRTISTRTCSPIRSTPGIENFVSADRGNDTNNLQPRLGATYDLRGNGTLVARAATGLYVTRNRPWLQQTSMDRTLGLRRAHHRPAAAAELPRHQRACSAAGRSSSTPGRRRAVAVSHRRRLRAALLVQHHRRHRLADQRASPRSTSTTCTTYGKHQLGTTDLNLPASGADQRRQSAAGAAVQPGGVLANFSKSWYDALEVQLRTRVRGTDSLQISYAYSKSTLDGVTFYSTFRGTERTPREKGIQPDRHAAQPQRGGVDVAALGRPAERRVPRDQRRAAGA